MSLSPDRRWSLACRWPIPGWPMVLCRGRAVKGKLDGGRRPPLMARATAQWKRAAMPEWAT